MSEEAREVWPGADVSVPTIKVRIPYKPRHWALGFHATRARWMVLILHRRAGKTTAVINHHQRAATNDAWEAQRLRALKPSLTDAELHKLVHPPGGRHYGHVMPHRNQAKLTIWDALKFYADPVPGRLLNESELMVRYPNGSKLQLFGADDPDKLRGPGFSGFLHSEETGSVLNRRLEENRRGTQEAPGGRGIIPHESEVGLLVDLCAAI